MSLKPEGEKGNKVTLIGFDLLRERGTEEQQELYRHLTSQILDKLERDEPLTTEEQNLMKMEDQLAAACAMAAAGGAIFSAVITENGLDIDRRDNWDW
jgi:hypothetical protein